jgi:hypothetical protein
MNHLSLEVEFHFEIVPALRLVDHGFAFPDASLLLGLPPNLPFSRDAAALRFDFASPRQAGQ